MSPILRRHWRWVGGRCNGSAVWKTVGERAAPAGGPRREPVALPPGQAQHAGALWQQRGQAASKPRLSSSGSTVTGRWLSAAGRRPARSATFDATQPRCVFTDDFFGPWIHIDGTAELVPLPDAMDGLIDYYRHISGEHPDWDDYRRHGGTATCAHPAVNRPRRPRPRRVAANSSPAKPHDAVRTRPSGCTCSDRPAHL